MTEINLRVNTCTQLVDTLLEEQNITPTSKKRFPVDGGSIGTVYQLGYFGIEITVHQFIIFSKFNSRHIDMLDYKNIEELMDYVTPIIQQFIDDPDITKHIVVRKINKLKQMFSFSGK